MAYETICIRISVEDYERVKRLRQNHVHQPEIFRRGLEVIEQESIDKLTQNNDA